MRSFPIEISLGGIYFPPIMFACIFGAIIAWALVRILNHYDLTRYIWHLPLFSLALAAACSGMVGLFIIPVV